MFSLRNMLNKCLGLQSSAINVKEQLFHPPIGYESVLKLREQLQYIEEKGVIPHPFMSRATTNMHEDGSASDVSKEPGPTASSRLESETYLTYIDEDGSGRLGMLPTLGYTSNNKIVAIGAKASSSSKWRVSDNPVQWLTNLISPGSVPIEIRVTGWKEFSLLLLNPESLEIEQQVVLPRTVANTTVIRLLDVPHNKFIPLTVIDAIRAIWGLDVHKLYDDTSGGAYFTLDNNNRAIIPTADNEIWIVKFQSGREPIINRIAIPGLEESDRLVSIAPTWRYEGFYWFATREGVIGVASLSDVVVARYDMRLAADGLTDEIINNSFAVGADGMYVVSSHALYRFDFRPDIETKIFRWRSVYNRGNARKCGQLPPAGSGTTPTLLGERFVAICDNATNMNVHIFERENGRTTSIERVFPTFSEGGATPEGASACDNSIVAYKFSLFIGNTYCYKNPFSPNPTGGLTRIDVDPDTGRTHRVWTKPDIAIWSAVPKYSSATNLLYIYARENKDGIEMWHVKGIDREGNIAVSIPIHEQEMIDGINIFGLRTEQVDKYDNGWGPLYLGLDEWGSPSIMLGMTQGLYRLIFT